MAKNKSVAVAAPSTSWRYVSDRFLAERYGVVRSTIWKWKAEGRLPPPEQLSPGITRWRLDIIIEFDRARAEGRKLPSVAAVLAAAETPRPAS